MIKNSSFDGWTGSGPRSLPQRAKVVAGWTVRYARSSNAQGVSFQPARAAGSQATRDGEPATGSGLRLEFNAPLNWVRILQPLDLPDTLPPGAVLEASVMALRSLDKTQGVLLDWVAILAEDKSGAQTIAAHLVRRRPIGPVPKRHRGNVVINTLPKTARYLLAVQFSGGPGIVELERVNVSLGGVQLEHDLVDAGSPAPTLKPHMGPAVSAVTAPVTPPVIVSSPPVASISSAVPPSHGGLLEQGLRGSLDPVTPELIKGWAAIKAPNALPVLVDILVDGELIARVSCSEPISALPEGGPDRLDCGFSLPAPASLSDGRPHIVEVRPTNLLLQLDHSPRTVIFATEAAESKIGAAKESDAPVGQGSSPLAVQYFAAFCRLNTAAVSEAAGLAVPEAATGCAVEQVTLDAAALGCALQWRDVWQAGPGRLFCRLEQSEEDLTGQSSLTAFQFDPADGQLHALLEPTSISPGMSVIELTLRQSFAPILLVARDAMGVTLGATLLPFPSLCRGGAHAGEVALLSQGADHLRELRIISDALLTEALGFGFGDAELSIGRIEVDVTVATGAEPIFASGFLAWLGFFANIPLVPVGDLSARAPAAGAHLAATLSGASLATSRTSEAVLRLPPDALPSLSALFSRRLSGTQQSCCHIIAEAGSLEPVWALSMPPMDAALLALQPRHGGLNLPVLLDPRPMGAEAGTTALPLAIRLLPKPADHQAQLAWPSALDHAAPLFATALSDMERDAARITLLLPAGLPVGAAAALLESVAQQTLAAQVDVILLGDATRYAALEPSLARLFTGRHIAHDVPQVGPSAALNDAASLARGNFLLLADGPLTLHDPRSLEALVTLMRDPAAATAGCVMLQEELTRRGRSLSFDGGGLFPEQISFLHRPHLVFAQERARLALPPATYPVVANSPRLMLIRATAWTAVRGLDAVRFPFGHATTDFALRCLRAGWRHLCTSAVCAIRGEAGPAHIEQDPVGAGFLPALAWADLARSVTVLRALR